MKVRLKSKLARILMCFSIIASVLVGTSTTAFAQIGGVETWYGPSDTSSYFTVTNDNLSPEKTMGYSGPLYVWIEYYQADASSSPIQVTLQIRNLTTGQTASGTFNASSGSQKPNVGMMVNTGDRIKIYIDVSTASGYPKPGYYRSARVRYGYSNLYDSWKNL